MAATSWTLMTNTPGLTVCSNDGTPYRTGPDGLIHVKTVQVAELSAPPRNMVVATAATAGPKHPGVPLIIFTDNDKDHG